MIKNQESIVKDSYGCSVKPGDIVAYAASRCNSTVSMKFYAIKEITKKGSIMAYAFDSRLPKFVINKERTHRLYMSRMLKGGHMTTKP